MISHRCWLWKWLLFHSKWNGLILRGHRDSILKPTYITKAAINSSITKMRVSACNDIIFLLTMSGWGIPVLALSSLDLFPLSHAPFQQVPSPNLPYMYLCLCWAWLPAPAATSTGWCCYGLYAAFPHFSGLQKGKNKKAGMTHREKDCAWSSRSLCVTVTHVFQLPQSKQPRKRWESLQAR